MNTISNDHEYAYTNSEVGHHHHYLMSPLMALLPPPPVTPQPMLRVLDLGCGNGSFSQQIAQQGYQVVGIEESASGVQLAAQAFPECQFMPASIYDLPYDKLAKSFDVVVSAEVIEHLLFPRELLQAAKKCLKPGGQLIITTPYHGYWKNLGLAISGKMDAHFSVLWDGGHIKFFSVATLAQLFQEEGFTDLQFKFAGRMPYLWKSMLCSARVSDSHD
jgi:2-polyprenyl-3-methyl-5-hydroxy-6-metoxy-1,4-benzoquinol methylase